MADKVCLAAVLRRECHEYMDVLWESKAERCGVYRWLAAKMRIPRSECHIGMMSVGRLYRARKILKAAAKRQRKRKCH